jgi:hypothetical protein
MDPVNNIPFCPPSWDTPSDVIPMLVVIAVFLIGGWLGRLWKRKQKAKRSKR